MLDFVGSPCSKGKGRAAFGASRLTAMLGTAHAPDLKNSDLRLALPVPDAWPIRVLIGTKSGLSVATQRAVAPYPRESRISADS